MLYFRRFKNLRLTCFAFSLWLSVLAISSTPSFLYAAPGDILFSDDFERAELGADWTVAPIGGGDAGIGTHTASSGTSSMYSRWDEVTVTSNTFDLSARPAASLRFWLRIGDDAFSEDPEATGAEDLLVEYLNNSGTWLPLIRYQAGVSPGQIFTPNLRLPADAFHAGFQFRFHQAGGDGEDWDYYHIDDVILTEAVPISPIIGGFCDDFESGLANWQVLYTGIGDAGIGTQTFNSAGNSLFLRWGPVTVESNPLDFRSETGVTVNFWLQRGDDAFSEAPDTGENFVVEYLNDAGTWILLETFDGGGTPGEIFSRSYTLGADALHAGLKVRFRLLAGSNADWDYWHLDDFCVTPIPPPATMDLRLDECAWSGTSADVLDSSGNNLHGTAIGSLSPLDIAGENGGMCMAANLTGGPYIEVPDNALLDISDNLTIMAWVKPNAIPASGLKTILSKDENYEFHIDSNGHIYWWWNDAGGTDHTLTSSATLNAGTWYHVAIRFSGGTATIFINGQPDVIATGYPASLGTNGDPLQIGADQGVSGREFEGVIDEILIFASALSSSQINLIYTNESTDLDYDATPRSCATCATALAYYQLDELAWGVVMDSSGNGNDAAVTGTVTPNDSAPALPGSPGTCAYAEINLNTSDNTHDAIDTGLDVNDDIGNAGTISFWYKSNEPWDGKNGDRQLFDASMANWFPLWGKYFFLVLRDNSKIRFGLKDSNNNGFTMDTGNNNYGVDEWVHIAVSWDLGTDEMHIYLNGNLQASQNISSTGSLGDLDTLYVGDNRSTYLRSGSSGNSANGAVDEIRIYNSAQDQAAIQTDMNATHPCTGTGPDHYAISHSGLGVTCEAEPVTITAHDSLHNPVSPGTTITISTTQVADGWGLQSGTLANFVDLGGGRAEYTFAGGESSVVLLMTRLTPAVINTDITDGSSTSERSGSATVLEDLPLDFRDAAFRFYADGVASNIGTQIAGRESNLAPGSQTLTLRTVQTNTDTGACEPRLVGSQSIEMAFECVDPATCKTANGVTITGIDSGGGAITNSAISDNPQGSVTSYTTGTLEFNATGMATFIMRYSDAGQIGLHIRKDIAAQPPEPAITLIGNSNTFTVMPAGLCVESPDANSDCLAIDRDGDSDVDDDDYALCSVFTPAGQNFNFTVRAVAWEAAGETNTDFCTGNNVTPNFQLNNIAIANNVVAPMSGSKGTISINGFDMVDADNGQNTMNQSVSEVGVFSYTATAPAYFGETIATSTSANIGRFTPTRLNLAANIPAFAPFCSSAGVDFVYLGQEFGFSTDPIFTISALNTSDNPVNNYAGSFLKLSNSAANRSYTNNVLTTVATLSRTTDGGNAVLEGNDDYNGSFTLAVSGDRLTYAKPVVPEMFFLPLIHLVLAPTDITDSDNICYDPDTDGICNSFQISDITSTAFQGWGRLIMQNNYGPATENLSLPLFTEYFDGTNFVPNIYDICSQVTLSFSNYTDNLNPGDTCVEDTGSPGVSGFGCAIAGLAAEQFSEPPTAGDFNLHFHAPGIGDEGSVRVTVTEESGGSWLQFDWDGDGAHDNDPSATATFGIYRGNDRIINWREIIQ